jgi:hypothetical protein
MARHQTQRAAVTPLGSRLDSETPPRRTYAAAIRLREKLGLGWLEERGFSAEVPTLGRVGATQGMPIGMQTANGKTAFRVEFDGRSGAHISVWSGKEKGPHFQFDASESTVTKIQRRYGRFLMTGNYWEAEFYSAPLLCDLDRSATSDMFDWLSIHFPVLGSKIDWSRVPGRHSHWTIHDSGALASAVVREVSRRVHSGSGAYHVGDGLSPYGVFLAGDAVPEITALLLEIPEHHYFVAGDRSWIVVVATEGDLDILDELSFPAVE